MGTLPVEFLLGQLQCAFTAGYVGGAVSFTLLSFPRSSAHLVSDSGMQKAEVYGGGLYGS